jgi:hypothetical protein
MLNLKMRTLAVIYVSINWMQLDGFITSYQNWFMEKRLSIWSTIEPFIGLTRKKPSRSVLLSLFR